MSHISEEVLTDMLWILEEVMKGELISAFNDKVYLCKQGVRSPNATEFTRCFTRSEKIQCVQCIH
jgi:hypothetical protein